MWVTALVPSYHRHQDLARCLAALRAQTRPPESVLVVLRADDQASMELVAGLSSWRELRAVTVPQPGVVAAMNTGVTTAHGDILAITDDDAEPDRDWIERIAATFDSDSRIAGVGGRDEQGTAASALDVGRVQWFGRVVGNHHVGIGPPRDVDVLKGANCAFRLPIIRDIGFDERLLGDGAQVHWELSLCLALRRRGYRLVYDPSIRVRHHVGIRYGTDQLHRGVFAAKPHEDAVYNETLILAGHLTGVSRVAFELWAVAIGTAESPGVLQVPRVLVREGRVAFARWHATRRARRRGFADSG